MVKEVNNGKARLTIEEIQEIDFQINGEGLA